MKSTDPFSFDPEAAIPHRSSLILARRTGDIGYTPLKVDWCLVRDEGRTSHCSQIPSTSFNFRSFPIPKSLVCDHHPSVWAASCSDHHAPVVTAHPSRRPQVWRLGVSVWDGRTDHGWAAYHMNDYDFSGRCDPSQSLGKMHKFS